MRDAAIKTFLHKLGANHDPDVRRIVEQFEAVVAERDALAFKYEAALERIIDLEERLAKAEGENHGL